MNFALDFLASLVMGHQRGVGKGCWRWAAAGTRILPFYQMVSLSQEKFFPTSSYPETDGSNIRVLHYYETAECQGKD